MTSLSDPAAHDDLEPYVQAALARKAFDLVILDVSGLSSVADAFIVCSGRSHRQVTAIAEAIRTELKRMGHHPLHTEGLKEGHWVLLDYGHVVLHVFYDPVRRFYDIESLWVDAPRITTRGLRRHRQAQLESGSQTVDGGDFEDHDQTPWEPVQ